MGRFGEGEPYQGVPRRTQSCTTHLPNKNRAARRNDKRFDSLARFFALDGLGMCHAAIFSKLRPRGHPRAACGPPFLLFGLRPRRNGVGFRPLRRARRGAAPPPCQPFEKGWTENLFLLFLPTLRKNFLRVSTIVAAQPVARLMKLGARMMAAATCL